MILDGKVIKHIHCLGIGGIGVSALAEILLKKGYQVSGSDIAPNKNTERLHRLGAEIIFNHNGTAVVRADCAIYSSAITLTNPEFITAQQAKIPLLKRGQMLAKMMADYQSIAVAGAHGKTTTSALLASTFVTADLDPTFMVGGVLNDSQTPVRVGNGPYFIAEADESDASFLYMYPNIGIITNIDADHLSTYGGDFNCLKKTYVQFLHQIPQGGVAVLCRDDPVLNELIPTLPQRVISYGFSAEADYRANNYLQKGLQTHFQVHRSLQDKSPLPVKLNLAGRHNALNALAVIGVGELIGMDEKKMLKSLAQFPGVDRRFAIRGGIVLSNGQALVIEDYGHHPNEIKATLSAARAAWPKRRLILVFQPHRYSRTQELMHDFASVLTEPDLLILLEVYSAGETPIPGADGKTLLKIIEQQTTKKAAFVPGLQDLPKILRKLVQPNDVVILQGAGNVGSAATTLIGSPPVSFF
ncbi:UDP-N-acetylmuramate--L-alanine ligase [Candidatus Coxiella mudrowiae]|uniref:UDP-N-acetylmuramate--L-alanine ligase n=1 Tax=Candidatus Coxiella mudrowiae TaxID=2054173 RepID=A0ABM5UVH9_9COXI|nr:UDP-N-acetylmuramate--L-alanine ligase [Candidatus Coxiella mudrowiae]AKQ33955.1 UDP-N-acetylmuramate--L-alanine ligase [Candidatus Coxiella mudrowiae]